MTLSSFREAGGPASVVIVAVAVAFCLAVVFCRCFVPLLFFSCHPSAKREDLLLLFLATLPSFDLNARP
jgi:hypothetical protein